MVYEKVIGILKDKDVDVENLGPDTAFDELGLDSLDRVELIMTYEEEFDVQIEMNESIRCVKDLVSEIERLIAAKGGAAQ
ncbi:MAG: phosphopantetheine-binding protein [Bacillota bacterium]